MTDIITQDDASLALSVNGKEWGERPYDERLALTLQQKHDVSDIVSRLLAIRNVAVDDVESYLSPTLSNLLPDPSRFLDMDKAAARLVKAVQTQEHVTVFGDYDVDGATSSALLKRYFAMVGLEINYYIPDRIKEGYGPNAEALLALKSQGTDVVVTVDCGATSYEPLAAAKQAGLDVIVIDHHLGAEELPDAVAVVNPNRVDEIVPYRNLAAVGVAFLLVVAVNRELRNRGWFEARVEPDMLSLLDLVALGTICDVMSLTGLNRAYVIQGLKVMAMRNNLGLRTLADIGRITEPPGVYHAGFILGPRINAGGRVGKSALGTQLLSTDDADEAYRIACELDGLNEERKDIEDIILSAAMQQAETLPESNPVVMVSGENWHPGVIGIVASRVKDAMQRPSAVIAWEGDIGKASARSVPGVDMGAAIIAARMEGLLVAGGGHAMAGGFTVERHQYGALQHFFAERLKKSVSEFQQKRQRHYDVELSVASIRPELVHDMEKVGPFGAGNAEPLCCLKNVRIVKTDVLGEKHIRCIMTDGGSFGHTGKGVKAMAFRSIGTALGEVLLSSQGKDITLIGKIRINRWQGNETAEFYIEDVVN